MTEGKPEEPVAEEPTAEEPTAEEPTAEEPTAVDPVAASPIEGVVPAENPPRPSSLGIWAFVLSLVGLLGLLPIIGSVLGFVLGRVAVRQSDSRRLRGGRGLAIAAVTTSVITLTVIVLSVAAYALAVAFLEI